ncbi:MAG TPA: alpha/beta fold hydrolase [Eudoraea sp.]|nr:alpha/beta fold hydrolase [Eudoraea sp.]
MPGQNLFLTHIFTVAVGMLVLSFSTSAQGTPTTNIPVESKIAVKNGSLYSRSLGQGIPAIVLHGGPDFDHSYLLPEFDQFKDIFHLIYYDQLGRGQSAYGVSPQDVTLASDINDIDSVRKHFGLDSMILIGHSWGVVLALEYAIQYTERVSHLILMNPAPASTNDVTTAFNTYLEKLGDSLDRRQLAIMESSAYKEGDPDTVTARYRIHFRPALMRDVDYESLMNRMAKGFQRQGKEGILKARAVEDQLLHDTWQRPDYDLLPRLGKLQIPTLLITGDQDFFPISLAEHIANALPTAELVVLEDCGHFSYLECPEKVESYLKKFLQESRTK